MASSGLIKSRERPRTKGGEKGEAEKEKREITERRLGRKTKKKTGEKKQRGRRRRTEKKKLEGNEGGTNEHKRKTKGTPSTSSAVAPLNLHLQQPLHQKQSKAFQGKKKGGGTRKRDGHEKGKQKREDRTEGKPNAGSGILASSQNSSDKLRKGFTQQRLWIR
jgi:hypothetical protein